MKKLIALSLAAALTASWAAADWGFWSADRTWIGIVTVIGGVTNETWYNLWSNGQKDWTNAFLGTFNPAAGDVLRIKAYDVKTWKTGGSDVQQCQYFYTVYQEGNRPGSPTWTSLGGGWLQDLGGGNQKWGNANCNTTNIAALISTLTNRLEVYGQVYGTNPNEWKYDNGGDPNGNYNARFVVIPEASILGLLTLAAMFVIHRR
ncbi:MAG: hypothetical protein N2595_08380 [bacterium]|nr:hypothetical protein [bacterium]